MYNLTSGNYIAPLKTVDNMFIRQVYSLAVNCAKQNKMLSIVTKNFMHNRGEVSSKSKKASEKSIIDLCKLAPLMGLEGAKNLKEEIALYRWNTLGYQDMPIDFWQKESELLMIDYLLSSSLCYVEVFEKGVAKVDKFYATRNRFIAAGIADIDVNETAKYNNYLTPFSADYRNKQLRVLKLNQNKSGFKITQPRSALDFKKKIVRVTPLFLIGAFVEGITVNLGKSILRFTYVKDNSQERELITTLSPTILMKYYEADFAQKMLNSCENKFNRGYIRVPELGCSKYDDTGVRALNLSRITSIEEIDEIDGSYISVDFNMILPTFKITLNEINDINILSMLYQGLKNDVPPSSNIHELKADINAFVDGQFLIGTTTFLKFLHKYMLTYKMIFKGYTGKPINTNNEVPDNFNLGIIE